jgi:hypothetical protein
LLKLHNPAPAWTSFGSPRRHWRRGKRGLPHGGLAGSWPRLGRSLAGSHGGSGRMSRHRFAAEREALGAWRLSQDVPRHVETWRVKRLVKHQRVSRSGRHLYHIQSSNWIGLDAGSASPKGEEKGQKTQGRRIRYQLARESRRTSSFLNREKGIDHVGYLWPSLSHPNQK